MRSQNKIRLITISLLLLINTSYAVAQNLSSKDIDDYAARILKEFEVPGMAVAVVKDGKVVHARGYGVKKLGETEPFTSNTLMGVASNSKAFTAAALAILVDEGKIAWDDAVIKHLPSFQMYDPYVTREMTIRDLLTHRSGLPLGAGDLMFWPQTTFTREEIVQRIRYLKPNTSFRTAYAYDNLLYLVAGEVIRTVAGKTWDDFIKERIFTPVGMTRSNTSITEFRSGDDIATPHAKADGKLVPIKYINIDNIAPAGSINSCITDMAKWMIVQLDSGVIGKGSSPEKTLFSKGQNREMWSPVTIMPNGNPYPELAPMKRMFRAYGLGWGVSDFRGNKIVTHDGGLAGQESRVVLMPDKKLGVVVLVNKELSDAAYASMVYHILDGYLGVSEHDWIKGYHSFKKWQAEATAAKVEQQSAARNTTSKPSLPMTKYDGTYRDAWYGDVTIGEENGERIMRFSRTPLLVGKIEHWQYDTFIVRWKERTLNADAFVYFSLNPNGSIERMKMKAVSPDTDFSYDFHDLLFVPIEKSK